MNVGGISSEEYVQYYEEIHKLVNDFSEWYCGEKPNKSDIAIIKDLMNIIQDL